jgi:hypothetical protein
LEIVHRAAPCRNVPVTFTLDRRVRDLVERLLAARRKSRFKSRRVFEAYAPATPADLSAAESHVGRALPEDLKAWLSLVGFGDVGEDLGFRKEFFAPVAGGKLKGGAQFAQDILGNFYAFPPDGDHVVFFSRSAPGYAEMAPSFRAFLEELEQRDYKVTDWVDSLELLPYAWSAV